MIETMNTNSPPPVCPAAISLYVFHHSHQFNTEKLIKTKENTSGLNLMEGSGRKCDAISVPIQKPTTLGFLFVFGGTALSGPGPPHE